MKLVKLIEFVLLEFILLHYVDIFNIFNTSQRPEKIQHLK